MATGNGTRVLVLDGEAERYREALTPVFPDIDFLSCTSYPDLPALLREHEPQVALTFKIGSAPFPRAALVDSGCVRWIHVGGAGVDHLQPWPGGVTVTNSSGIHGDIMAEYVLAAVIAFNHNGRRYELQQARRQWRKFESRSVAGQTLVIVGFGSIGAHVARLARNVGMTVIGVRSRPERKTGEEQVVGPERLEWALGQADHVAVCLPLTGGTRGMIGAHLFASMKPGVHLINVSRGGIVVEDALLDSLRIGHVAGATLDVFATEPLPPESPFWSLETVRVTPHSSSDVAGWQQRVMDLF